MTSSQPASRCPCSTQDLGGRGRAVSMAGGSLAVGLSAWADGSDDESDSDADEAGVPWKVDGICWELSVRLLPPAETAAPAASSEGPAGQGHSLAVRAIAGRLRLPYEDAALLLRWQAPQELPDGVLGRPDLLSQLGCNTVEDWNAYLLERSMAAIERGPAAMVQLGDELVGRLGLHGYELELRQRMRSILEERMQQSGEMGEVACLMVGGGPSAVH